MKLTKNGQVTTKTHHQERGNNPRTIAEDERTEALGPFSVNPVHAEVRASLRVTPSKNYQSIAMECSVMIPVDATEDAIQAGYEWAFKFCDENISRRVNKARLVLKDMARD